GINDYFALPEGTKVGEFEIFIYNRWGMLVYHSEDPHFKWDGSVNGKIFQNQTYTYVIFAEPVDIHKKEKYHGIVTVL
ncbi:MAG: gliding motility-associated C-terminal domain-containing protein, partial [Bacteroidales bacterium]|nr:gliding motility-associated C-terminal domain-containing protein [Bacteroidales bacterium]